MAAREEDHDTRELNYRSAQQPRCETPHGTENEGDAIPDAIPDAPSNQSGDGQPRTGLHDTSPVPSTSIATHDISLEAINKMLEPILKDVASIKKDLHSLVNLTHNLSWRVQSLEAHCFHSFMMIPSTELRNAVASADFRSLFQTNQAVHDTRRNKTTHSKESRSKDKEGDAPLR
ncbi:hypothetical protein FSARC_7920 [Fusarium sarcochroum]|uniref:Uncharacterized protein n=1 Tax=Fusarium sarcochroum TaxID=1208366 RepID=A0A8H4TU10_9HYPO|nr:hypothetical protein FSARC_7920 [Fusarium sarcochroum]